jgi:inner membrane protease ATP23
MATGRMSPVGQKQYWEDADTRYSAADCRSCESHRDFLLSYSPVVRYMADNISKLGGDLGKHNIRCRTCKTGMMGGFDKDMGIVMCAQYLDSRSKVEDTLAHEMVHAYDHLRFNIDWSDLKHVACTEIRASNLSGECRWANEFFGNKQMKFNMHHQECVRRRAVRSVMARPQCQGEGGDLKAVRAVNEVWESCFRDTRPFDEIYR